jgi:hypothetical protein
MNLAIYWIYLSPVTALFIGVETPVQSVMSSTLPSSSSPRQPAHTSLTSVPTKMVSSTIQSPRKPTYPDFLAACFLIAAHLFFCAAAMRFRPAALIVRLVFLVAGLAACGAAACLIFAHRAFSARAIFRLTAALRFFRGFRISDEDAGSDLPTSNMSRTAAILPSSATFCTSNPMRAAERMSAVSLSCGM